MTVKPKMRKTICFQDLAEGDFFLWENELHIKIENTYNTEQVCVRIRTGEHYSEMCGTEVIPVVATITWKPL